MVVKVGERERIAAAEDALARRRRVVAKLEAQANSQAQQQRAFARVSFPAFALHVYTCCLLLAVSPQQQPRAHSCPDLIVPLVFGVLCLFCFAAEYCCFLTGQHTVYIS